MTSPYAPPTYDAIRQVNTLHNLPRLSGTNVIPTSDYSDYFIGVAILPAVLFLVYVVWAIILCCPCCRRCCLSSTGSKLFTLRCAFLAVGFGAIGALVAAFYGSYYFEDGYNQILDSSDQIQGLFSQGIEASDETSAALTAGIAAANAITCPGDPTGLLVATIKAAGEEMKSAQAPLLDYTKNARDINSMLSDINSQLRKGSSWIQPVTVAFLSVVAAFVVAYMAAAALTCCDKHHPGVLRCVNYFVYPTSFVLLFVIMLMGAVICAVGIVSSDVCFAPNEVLLRQINATQDAVSFEISSYYIECAGTNPLDQDLNTAKDEIAEAARQLEQAQDGIDQYCQTAAEIAVLQGSLNTSLAQVDRTLVLVGCASVNPIYQLLVPEGFCTTMFRGSVQSFSGIVFAGLLMLTMLSFRSVYDDDSLHEKAAFEQDVPAATGAAIAGTNNYQADYV